MDELRPGNFVFYDLMQWRAGACRAEDIAVAVACPVIGKHADRSQVILYGGAVHLGQESLRAADGSPCFGYVASCGDHDWQDVASELPLISLSQEHGIVQATPKLFRKVQVGDLLAVLPVHSCLTVNLHSHYLTLEGERIPIARLT